MGARTGQQFLDGLRDNPREVYIEGERVRDVTSHRAFQNVLESLAHLYDMQHDPQYSADLTYVSPVSGERVGTSFMLPRSRDDLLKRGRAMRVWARYSNGMMGRTPDYLSSSLMAFAAARDYFAVADPRFGDNVESYYRHARENDLCLTHTLINPQANRSVGPSEQADPYLPARVVEERDGGIVVRGARMLATLGPIADELEVFPSTVVKTGPEDAPYAFGFVVPCSAPGLKFICRETYDLNRSKHDHPLGSRFEEMDSVIIFDDVFVPWERVFLYGDPELANGAFGATNAVIHMAHQVMAKNIAKTEFMLGLVSLIVDTIAIEPFQHVHEKVAEVIIGLESMRALLKAAEADAQIDRWGIMTPARGPLDAARNLYPKLYPRFVEIVQQLSASGLMATPTEADLNGPMGPAIERYFTAARADSRTRIALFRLAWDVAVSSFGSRQVLYERFFFGDPVRMAGALFNTYDKQPYMDRVREFIEQGMSAPVAEVSDGDA
ncbi:MAG TPA: 4-hydroxyphenylacetate 3-monooxygenase, oxygenase component [Thermomicrobiales bacterium]|nr:4-hydroxyphenylacetate 3-monooxygenase, oxygenase component [Thermomicrobiales bacterium]